MFAFGSLKVLEYSILTSASEMIYMPMGQDVRYLGKELIRFFGHRMGRSVASLALSTLTAHFRPITTTQSMWCGSTIVLWLTTMCGLSLHLWTRDKDTSSSSSAVMTIAETSIDRNNTTSKLSIKSKSKFDLKSLQMYVDKDSMSAGGNKKGHSNNDLSNIDDMNIVSDDISSDNPLEGVEDGGEEEEEENVSVNDQHSDTSAESERSASSVWLTTESIDTNEDGGKAQDLLLRKKGQKNFDDACPLNDDHSATWRDIVIPEESRLLKMRKKRDHPALSSKTTIINTTTGTPTTSQPNTLGSLLRVGSVFLNLGNISSDEEDKKTS